MGVLWLDAHSIRKGLLVIRKSGLVIVSGLLIALSSCVVVAGASTKQQKFKVWIDKVGKFSDQYVGKTTRVKDEIVSFVANHNPAPLDALTTTMAVDSKDLQAIIPLAPSYQLKVATLAFDKSMNTVAGDVLLLTEPNLVPTLTMAKTTATAINRSIAIGNEMVAAPTNGRRLTARRLAGCVYHSCHKLQVTK